MMVVTSPKLSGLVHRRDPAHRAAAGRLRPLGAAQVARWRRTRWPTPPPMPASRSARSARCRPSPTRSWSPAVFAARSKPPSRRRGRRSWRAPCSPSSPSSRSSPRSWRCCGSARATCWPAPCRPARSASSCSIRCSRPARSARCRKSGASFRQAAGAAERLTELLAEKPAITGPGHPDAAAGDSRRRGRVRRRLLHLSGAARPAGAARPELRGEARRDGGDRRPVRRRQEHGLLADPALLRPASRRAC